MPQPGDVVAHFTTKTGQQAEIRYPLLSDVPSLTDFINIFSPEDNFTRFSGEQMTVDEEKEYIESELKLLEAGDVVKLFCFVEGKLAGVSDIHRDTSLLKRKRHVGNFGIIIGKEFRGQGVGEQLMRHVLSESEKHIEGLKLFHLTCFASNTNALALYHKLGFTGVGRIPKMLFRKNEYDDEVIMVREV